MFCWDSLALLLTVLGRFDHAVHPTVFYSYALACTVPRSREMRAMEISAELSPPSAIALSSTAAIHRSLLKYEEAMIKAVCRDTTLRQV